MEITISANLAVKSRFQSWDHYRLKTPAKLAPPRKWSKEDCSIFQEALFFFELEEKELTDFPGIKVWRKIFKTDRDQPVTVSSFR